MTIAARLADMVGEHQRGAEMGDDHAMKMKVTPTIPPVPSQAPSKSPPAAHC